MESMEHLFREQEMKEMQKATGRTFVGDMFKTALYRAEKAQYNMRVKIDKAEAERVMVYAERVPRTAKEITTITIYRKSEPERRVDLSRVEALRLIGELKEALML
ncbi:hypothetical protein BK687P1_00024 [Bacteroides phage BK687P1]|nr:hypothetical protein BK687P1_00024 [Bacteroides phage BK687P1]